MSKDKINQDENQKILEALVDPDAEKQSTFPENLEENILAYFLHGYANHWFGLIKDNYFKANTHRYFYNILSKHFKEFNTLPTKNIFFDLVEKFNKPEEDKLLIKSLYNKLDVYFKTNINDGEYLKRAVRHLLEKAVIFQGYNELRKDLDSGKSCLNKMKELEINLTNINRQLDCDNDKLTRRFYPPDELRKFNFSSNWLLEKHILCDSIVSIYGLEDTYKSFLALTMAFNIATGTKFLGQYRVEQGSVAYVCSESVGGLLNSRLPALCDYYEIDCPQNLYICAMDYNLVDMSEAIELVRKLPPLVKAVIIDTKSRNFMGKEDEVNTAAYLKSCIYIRQETKAAVINICHTGKDTDAQERGSNVWRCGIDTGFYIEKTLDCEIMVINDKQKDFPKLKPYPLVMQEYNDSLIVTPPNKLLYNSQHLTETGKLLLKYILTNNLNNFSFKDALKSDIPKGTISKLLKKMVELAILQKDQDRWTVNEEVKALNLIGVI